MQSKSRNGITQTTCYRSKLRDKDASFHISVVLPNRTQSPNLTLR